jgi:anti-sigma regulatory factor (Ser/Thr protein kinase)
MAVVEVSFSALPAYVRTARLIAVEVARRAGIDEATLDEIRLAVGEACAQAVRAHRRHAPHARIGLALAQTNGKFRVEVHDFVPQEGILPDHQPDDAPDSGLGEALLTSLVDDIHIVRGERGGNITMHWPIAA